MAVGGAKIPRSRVRHRQIGAATRGTLLFLALLPALAGLIQMPGVEYRWPLASEIFAVTVGNGAPAVAGPQRSLQCRAATRTCAGRTPAGRARRGVRSVAPALGGLASPLLSHRPDEGLRPSGRLVRPPTPPPRALAFA